MGKLTQIQIEKGLEYWFIEDGPDKNVVELAEYSGEKELTINCTQLDGYPHGSKYKSAKEKNVFYPNGANSYQKIHMLLQSWHLEQECLNYYRDNDDFADI